MILEQCKQVHCVDLGESFQTHILLQNLASIAPITPPPRTSPVKFARQVCPVKRGALTDAMDAGSEPASPTSPGTKGPKKRQLGEVVLATLLNPPVPVRARAI